MDRFRCLGILGAFLWSTASAHHSPSAYDMTGDLITGEGRLTEVDWANPHIYLTLETAGPNGQRVLQRVEAVSVSLAQATGLSRDVPTIGSAVVINAYSNRRGSGTVLGTEITMSDGDRYPLRGGPGKSPADRDRPRKRGLRAIERRSLLNRHCRTPSAAGLSPTRPARPLRRLPPRAPRNPWDTRRSHCRWWQCWRCCEPLMCATTAS